MTQLHQHLSQILDFLHSSEELAIALFSLATTVIALWQILKAHLK